MKKTDYLTYRKISWLFNGIFFQILKITKFFRSKKIWAFAAQKGMKYDDNSMYLFEYVNQNYKAIRAIWFSKNQKVINELTQKGYEVYNVKTFKGFFMLLKPGVCFYTAGLDDFSNFPIVSGSKIVSLWHGVGFKKIYNETYSGKTLIIKKNMDKFFTWTYRDISIATSAYTKNKIINRFNKKEKDIYITGQPRNDVFNFKLSKSQVIVNALIHESSKWILYMPTYRWNHDGNYNLSLIVRQLVNNQMLKKFLIKNNYKFIIKLHPKSKLQDEVIEPFFLLNDENVVSNQKLLSVVDILITDYSSCFIDYALIKKPILFYTPDQEEYLETAGGLEKEYFKYTTNNKANTIEELCELFINIDNKELLAFNNKINSIFHDTSINDTCYSENVCSVIFSILNINIQKNT